MTCLRLLNSATVKDDMMISINKHSRESAEVEGCHNIHINRQLWRLSLCTKQGSRYSQKIQKKMSFGSRELKT